MPFLIILLNENVIASSNYDYHVIHLSKSRRCKSWSEWRCENRIVAGFSANSFGNTVSRYYRHFSGQDSVTNSVNVFRERTEEEYGLVV